LNERWPRMSTRIVPLLLVLCLGAVSLQSGCRATGGAKGESVAEQQSTIRSEQSATLNQLYAARPELRAKVTNAAGHAFFSNLNVNVLLLSTENGYGVVHNNGTGKDTFMKMAGAGAGLGIGVKDYRVVFIFTDPAVMQRFVDSGWDFGGQADAAAKTGETGAAASGTTTAGAVAGMEIYQFTQSGLALQATVQGTKYWRDEALNK
jgi:lipid-binding SYLF domain-containing protein